jgi:TorA maturation chaperone TorD
MRQGYYLPNPEFHYFLSNLFLSGPSREFVSDLWNGTFPAFPDSFPGNDDLREGHGLLITLKDHFEKEDDFYQAFQDEFIRLFFAPVTAYPYQSVYLDTVSIGGVQMSGLMMGESAERVRDSYSEYGFGKTVNLPEDHISFELAFLGRLYSLHENTGDGAYLAAARNFLEEHLIRWVPRFCDDLYDEADLYKPVAKILKGLVLYEYEALMLQSDQLKDLYVRQGTEGIELNLIKRGVKR